MADGRVEFEIVADGKKAISSVKDVTKTIQSETKKWDDAAEGSAKGAEDSWKLAVGKIAGALSAAAVVSTLTKWGKAAIDAASDLEEVQNVVDVTFGDGANKIESWSKKAGKQFGLTETQAKKFTSTLGAMMKSAGLSGDEIVDMSTDLAGLAADMASFYNLDFETAFQKIRSGISGETEPLKQLGINMSVANLQAFALEQGITKSFDAMSQGEQTMLRYQYMMQATADAQGDFARTSDGFANASRQMKTALETIKTEGGKVLLTVIKPLATQLAGILTSITSSTDNTTIFDDFANIDKDLAGKMADLEETYNKASSIVGVLAEIEEKTVTLADGSTLSLPELFSDIANVEKEGGNVNAYIESLGLDVDYITQKYKVWREATKQLTSDIPELTSVINSETGAIDGGTDALDENLKAWKANEEKKLRWAAYYAKERALAERDANLFMLDLDAGTARKAAENFRKKLTEAYGATFDEAGNIDYTTSVRLANSGADSQWFKDVRTYTGLLLEQREAEKKYAKEQEDNAKAHEDLANAKEYLIQKLGPEEEATKKTTKAVEDYTESVTFAKDAVSSLLEYVQSVRDATAQTVDGIVKGFDKLVRPTTELEEKRSKLIEQQMALNQTTDEGKRKYQEYQKQIDEINKSIGEYNTTGMKQGLQSQLAFMNEYMDNLERAKGMGLSNELLAYLSDGSVESAEYLANLVSNPEQAQEVDALYQEVAKKKSEFTDSLTDQKLTVDETYQGMVDKAKESIAEMDLSSDAAKAMGNTVAGLASGITSEIPAVEKAVNSLLEVLSKIGGTYGVTVGGSTFSFTAPSFVNKGGIQGEYETGLDYVPFDGFLAGLHQGEGILTAEENRIWQRFKNGSVASQNVDYDALGATMRDNVKAGGNVYLDGRVVGSVISAQQANSYRSLTRSGWQQ